MAITTTGWDGTSGANPNTCKISIANGDLLSDLITAVEAFLTTHNWALYDAVAGTNARAYRCLALPDANAVTHYGYIVLDYNTSGYLLLKHYESWNATTHVGTNLAIRSDSTTYCQRVPANTTGTFTATGWLRIHASKFGIVLVGNNGANTGCAGDSGPTFVFQTSRVCPEDTVTLGYAKWVWGTTHGLGLNDSWPLSVSRSPSGVSGSTYMAVTTDFGYSGHFNGNPSYAGNTLMPARVDYSTSKLNFSNIRAKGAFSDATSSNTFGTVLDLIAVTNTQGSTNTDDITFNVDEEPNFGGAAFAHAGGTPQAWWLIGGTTLRLAIRK